ncbi:homocysteine-responsive endoplasmic reticulum-resident ubiquitin-like domain member 2 protein [Chrysoperla carnea]|uniref:homocysteine-responsive endoplasmic reticulum-resident ubiquitin-like domain member 2 protein n=1 Tax=Chrysoperla carnea TaxID=189513 RepID=UPI001D089F09|nr:homocysteine-responsive endoplasmic reticulum-resident ubiquitin-like domain member 2 protein [Chrysoperla carnea]
MDDLSVTLIVKAPNQQIEDQIIQCELSWTIKKLKTYLSEVYPSKPGVHDQKLIYSGQLLADSLILKDILRRYEGQETHTVHLVCTPSKYYQYTKTPVNIMKPSPSNPIPSTSTSGTSSPSTSADVSTTPKMKCDDKTSTKIKSSENAESVASCSKEQPTNSSNVQKQETITSQNQSSGSRLEEENQVPNPQMLYSMNNQVYAAQLAMFQQHYINYMNHYMKMYVNQMQNVDAQKMLHGNIPETIANNQADENRVPPVAEAAVRGPEPVQNVNAAEQDEGIIDRDWLDWFYVLSRLTVLLSIVYFYSSPLRFIIVFLLGCTMYLYQIGFFRVPLENNNAINNNVDPIVENNNNRRNDAQREQRPVRENLVQGDHANIASTPSQAPIQMVPDRPTVLGVMWTFFTTFFASLIPEIPNAI